MLVKKLRKHTIIASFCGSRGQSGSVRAINRRESSRHALNRDQVSRQFVTLKTPVKSLKRIKTN